MLFDRQAATIVLDTDGTVVVNNYTNTIAATGKDFIEGVIDSLVDQMMQAEIAGRPDVHSRPLSNCFQFRYHNDRIGGIAIVIAPRRVLVRYVVWITLAFVHTFPHRAAFILS